MPTSPLPHTPGADQGRSPATPATPTTTAALVRPWDEQNIGLDSDLFQRYAVTAQVLARVVAGAEPPARILELGANYLNPLPRFLDPQLATVTRADIQPSFADPDFVLLQKDQPLPFANESFDAVVALDVLEHMPVEARRPFLAECLRVARHGVVFSSPNGVPEVIEAEQLAAASFRQRHGKEHPFLREHRDFGLPREEEVLAILRELDVPHAVLDNAPLDLWLPMLLLAENLLERQGAADLQYRLNRSFLRGGRGDRPVPYRKIYVCAKSFDATAALEPPPEIPFPAGVLDLPPAVSPLHLMATVASDALSSLDRDRRDERTTHEAARANLQGELTRQRTEAAELHARLNAQNAEVARLSFDLAARQEDLLLWRRQHMMLHSFIEALTKSGLWKLLAPLRLARRTLRPRGLDERALIPWNQLVPHPKGEGRTWFATGNDAHFIVPCYLPAGWLRIRLKMASDVLGRAELFFDSGRHSADNQALDADCRERFDVHGRVDRDEYFYLPRPAMGLRFAPLDVPGQFDLESLQITPLAPPAALMQALRTKFGLLWQYGVLSRALGNGVGMLLRGEFGEFAKKLNGGLAFQKAVTAKETSRFALAGGARGQTPDNGSERETQAARPRNGQPFQRLDIVYVLKSAGLCGGVKVILEHVSRLHARGHNAQIYYLDGEMSWFPRHVPATRFDSLDELKQALAEFRGIKVATWHETAPWVAESLRPGDRGYYHVQDIEETYCATPEDAAAALATYDLGLQPLSEGTWVREQLERRFNLKPVFVSIGLDFDLFQPRLVMRDPNRVLTQARTWSGGGVQGAVLKGWETAKQTVVRAHQLNPRMTLATFSIEEKALFPREISHVHYQKPSDEQLTELYCQAGLYLLTSNHEGFGLTAAEAMACGCPVVATRANGNEEFCIDGVTALTAPPGDVEQLARKCLELQSDPKFARELGQNARSYILSYTWDRVVDRLEQEFLKRPGPEIVLNRPTRSVRASADDLDRERDAYRTLADAEFGRAPTGRTPDNASGEYPDLQLTAPPDADCTLVIPAVNDVELVTQCVTSARRYAPPGTRMQYIVVDDGTRDPEILRQLRQASQDLGFELLFNHQNLGFSAAVNHGLRHARGRYAVLCNNDIVFFQPWFEPLEKAFTADPHLGVIGAKLLYPDGSLQHAGVDKVPGQLKWHHAFGRKPGDHPPANQSRYCWSVTGALYAIRREALQRLGGLSTAYTTAYEDLDYSLHAWLNGVRVGYCSAVAAYHLEGGTRGATETKKTDFPLWAERERAGGNYFEKKWQFLRHVENFQALLSLLDRPPAPTGTRLPAASLVSAVK